VYSLLEPSKCKVVAIAEPRLQTRELFLDRFEDVEDNLVFETWEQFHKASAEAIETTGKRLADALVIAVQDQMHLETVVAFAAQGYDILCEKPMATSIEHCLEIEDAVKKANIIFGMGHGMCRALSKAAFLLPPLSMLRFQHLVLVLRYSSYARELTTLVRSGKLGQLINIQHIEPVGHWHFAHSYVRGNWAKESECCFSLMTKSCQYVFRGLRANR
jgi:hypothetical protein